METHIFIVEYAGCMGGSEFMWKAPLSIFAVFIVIISTITILWNISTVQLDRVDVSYVGRFYHGTLADEPLNYLGVMTARTMVENKARPALNPATILWQHFWYNCFTTGYDQVLWLESKDNFRKRQYALYISGKTVFLRLEPDGWNQVLTADFTAQELERALEGFLKPLPAEAEAAD